MFHPLRSNPNIISAVSFPISPKAEWGSEEEEGFYRKEEIHEKGLNEYLAI